MNHNVRAQYKKLLTLLCFKAPADVSVNDRLAVVYFLLLQDRVGPAIEVFRQTPCPANSITARCMAEGLGGVTSPAAGTCDSALGWTVLQYDYLSAYLDFYNDAPVRCLHWNKQSDCPDTVFAVSVCVHRQAMAREIAAAYVSYPVTKWRLKFEEVAKQLALAALRDTADTPTDLDSRDQRQAAMAAQEPTLDFEVDGGLLSLTYCNVSQVTIRYYAMDVELLFSTSPFLVTKSRGQSTDTTKLGQFSYVRPNVSQVVSLPTAPVGHESVSRHALPASLGSTANVMIEVVSREGDVRVAKPHYSNGMRVHVSENYGQLRVTDAETGAPLARVYVKVFFSTTDPAPADGSGQFYKDGYTDITGRFDYTSLNTDELTRTKLFAILAVSREYGSVVRQAAPPKQ